MRDDKASGKMEASLQAKIDQAPFHHYLRPFVESVDSDKGEVTLRLDIRPDMARVPGEAAAHGGVIAALADISAHAAVMVMVGRTVPTVDLRLDYMRPAAGAVLRAHAAVLRCGRSLATVDVRLVNDDGKIAAVARGTFLTSSVSTAPGSSGTETQS
jgi:uncharacterized protein (TIGR00369 family)